MAKDQIMQWEIAAIAHLGDAADVIALGFWRRLARGADIERGAYTLTPEPNHDSDDTRRALRHVPSSGYTCSGFDIAWADPAKVAPKPKARKPGRVR